MGNYTGFGRKKLIMENGNADLQIDGLLRLAEPWLAHLQKNYLDVDILPGLKGGDSYGA